MTDPEDRREARVRKRASHYGYLLRRGPRGGALTRSFEGFVTEVKLPDASRGYTLFDRRTGLNVLGGADGPAGLGATAELQAWCSSIEDVERFLDDIEAQVARPGTPATSRT
jgi:hypothetical protein